MRTFQSVSQPERTKEQIYLLQGFVSVCLAGFLCLTGCKPAEPNTVRYRLSGTVQFDGKPVHSGRITVLPDTRKGNSGPAGFAEIVDGKFDTEAEGGKGVIGGSMLVSIDAFSEETITVREEGEVKQLSKRLVSGYEKQIDLPKKEATIAIDIPASSGPKNTAR